MSSSDILSFFVQYETTLTVGIISGVIAGLAVLAAQKFRQWWLDNLSDWPFEVDAKGLKPLGPSWEARVWTLNKTTRDVRLNVAPLDAEGREVQGWSVRDFWTNENLGVQVTVRSHSWTEFVVTGPGGPPTNLRLFASFFSLVKGKERVIPVLFTFEFR